jgi:hypothetical protein
VALGGALVLVAVALVAGVSGNREAAARPSATTSGPPAALPGAPSLDGSDVAYTRVATVEVRGRLPDGVPGGRGYKLRVYVDDTSAKEVTLPVGSSFIADGVPVPRGESRLTASVIGPRGEGARSRAVRVVFDASPPEVTVLEPSDGAIIDAAGVVLTGGTERGAAIDVIRSAVTAGVLETPAPPVSPVTSPADPGESASPGTSAEPTATPTRAPVATAEPSGAVPTARASGTAGPDGKFAVEVPLARGVNELRVTVTDLAGNESQRLLRVIRSAGAASAELTLSRVAMRVEDLPQELYLTAVVLDGDGRRVSGAEVTFTLSPAGVATSSYDAVTDARGEARWGPVSVPREGAIVGGGFATVRAVLPGGQVVQSATPFTLE